MKFSELFTKTRKENPKDEEAINAQLLIRGGYVDKVMAGVYNFLPLGNRVLKNIEGIVRNEMNSLGHEILMPVLNPKENWKTTDRYDSYDVLFRFTSHFSKIDYVLGPTHEEMVTPLVGKFILSYKDLPTSVFQIQTKFRDEKRSKSDLLRGREFLMKDLYSFHTSQEDLDSYYDKVQSVYTKIFKQVGLDSILTYASGGAFSKYSHEFQTLTESGEDIIHMCEKCGVAVNKEIIADQPTCPKCDAGGLTEKKAIEVGNIFKLGTRFTDSFGIKYKDEKGDDQPVVMGCYGIGVSRLMGAIVEVHHDDKGIIWPESVAPFKVHLIVLDGKNEEAEKIYNELKEKNVDVLFDDREGVSAGEKFADADLIGIPTRLVLSKKSEEKGGIEIKKRSEKDSLVAPLTELIGRL